MSIQLLMNKDPSLYAYIGCMTGTSADKHADFSVALFERHTLIAHNHYSIAIPEVLRLALLKLSTSDIVSINSEQRADIESQFTHFLADAFKKIIHTEKLEAIDSNRIILSPHGQTIDHRPDKMLTDQLIHGEQLAYETGCPVVFRHRQACINISQAAPLAPVFLQTLPVDPHKTHIFINGAGVANICIVQSGQPLQAFDTGPANGPIDAMIAYLLEHHADCIPPHLYAQISDNKYDAGGQLAAAGNIDNTLKTALLNHSYLNNQSNKKSLDRSAFGLEWLLSKNSALPLLDQFATLTHAVTESIVIGITQVLKACKTPCELWISGGIRHNKTMHTHLINALSQQYVIQLGNWDAISLNPDYLESLLMAYLGMCVHQKQPINLDYCLRETAKTPYAIPGVLTCMEAHNA